MAGDADSFIEFDARAAPAAPVSFGPDPAKPAPPAAARPPVKRRREPTEAQRLGIKATAADRLYYAILKESCDLKDVHRKTAFGEILQISNAEFERSLNAEHWSDRLTPLRLHELAVYRRGHGPTTYIRPRPNRREANPVTLLRIDLDEHEGQTDAADVLAWIGSRFPGLRVYVERSDRGWSAYTLLHLPAAHPDRDTGEVKFKSNAWIEETRRELQAALRALIADAGFKATLDVCGSPALVKRNDEGRLRSEFRGNAVRLPRCPRDEDVETLNLARCYMGDLKRVITGAARLSPGRAGGQASSIAQAPRPATARQRRAAGPAGLITATGDKHKDRLNCVGFALKQIVGPRSRWHKADAEQLERVVAVALHAYERNGLASGERDRSREVAFANIARWCADAPHTAAAACEDEVWFGDRDLEWMEQRIRSVLPADQLDQANNDNRRKLDGSTVTYPVLAIAACTFGKNAATSDGDVPATSVRRMLQHFGIRANGTTVALCREILMSRRLLGYVSRHYRVGSQCRKYRLLGVATQVPFLAGIETKGRAHQRQGQRYLRAAGQKYGAGEKLLLSISIRDGTRASTTQTAMRVAHASATGVCAPDLITSRPGLWVPNDTRAAEALRS